MSSSSAEVTRIVTLPPSTDGTPPLVSCVAVEEDGRAYLTDELNHRVLGFDSGGSLLWSMGSRGSGEGQFRYPRGICAGWIEKSGSRTRCLGVADSWNERVFFLDLAGNPLHEWRAHGGDPFGQIIDLRYVPPEEGEPGGTWLLLDRTKHRLLALAESGMPLFSAGRELPPSVRGDWQLQSLSIWSILRNQDSLPILPPRDYLYYPYRFLGKHPESLMVWEPLARTLKVCLWGSFLPITQIVPDTLEWITADSAQILGWEADPGVLYCFGVEGTELGSWPVDGRPVPSNVDPPYCWIQVDNGLHRVRVPLSEAQGGRTPLLAAGVLALSVTKLTGGIGCTAAQETVASTVRPLDHLRAMAEVLVDALSLGRPVTEASAQKLRAGTLQSEFARLLDRLTGDLNPLRSPAVCWRYATLSSGGRLPAAASGPDNLLARLLQPLRDMYPRWVRTYDRLRLALLRIGVPQTTADLVTVDVSDAAWAVFAALLDSIEGLYANIGPGSGSAEKSWRPLNWRDGFGEQDRKGGHLRRSARPAHSISAPLEEIRVIQIIGRGADHPAKPFHLCRGPEDQFFVGLFEGHEVQCLDQNGNVTLRLGEAGSEPGQLLHPTGVLFDRQNRVWVSDAGNRRIQVWVPPYEEGPLPVPSAICAGLLEGPAGLYQLPSGEVLVADSLGNRLWKIGAAADVSLWSDRSGSGAGELLNPISFAQPPRDPAESFWLVDRGNHRIQRFDATGQSQACAGHCGLDDDCLFAPRSVACFSDGTLVVAEDRNPGCLVFLTEEGSVTGRMTLDYVPGTLIAMDDRILVTDMTGDKIRVYTRL